MSRAKTNLVTMRVCLNVMLVAMLLSLRLFAQAGSQPVIDRIDPPNWWPSLPDPMLLIYGRNLKDAHFDLIGQDVQLLRTESSSNGHYAFLWLSTKASRPQDLEIDATNAAGRAKATFSLRTRLPTQGRFQGVNPADVIYLVMTDRFADGDPTNNQPAYAPDAPRGWHGGDFAGVRRHFDYLQKLGVTALWMTPILSNGAMPESYHGYAAVDLYAVDSHFGSLDDYRSLADDLHARGMKIIFDIVPNHIGVQHPWVLDPPTADWFHGTLDHHELVQSDFAPLVDPHATTAARFNITRGWFTDGMPDLNQGNPLVAKYLIQNAIWWIETAGLDGLRIDTFPYVDRAFWSEFHRTIHENYPALTTVGEIFNKDANITSYFAGGLSHEGIDTGLYTPFDYPMYFALRDVLARGKPMTELESVLADDHLYPHPDRLVTFFGNHDTRRFLSESGANLAKLKLAYALLATLRGTPEIYSGDEIAMEGKEDPDNRRDFPGGFKSSTRDAFSSDGRTPEQNEVFDWASALFRLRKEHEAITTGSQQDLYADTSTFAFLRGDDLTKGCSERAPERILIFANASEAAHPLEFSTARTGLENCTVFTPLLPSRDSTVNRDRTGKLSVTVAPGATIYAVR